MDSLAGDNARKLAMAGAALLGEQGIAGVTVRAVAERARVAIPTLQHYFPHKEQLLDAIVAESFEQDSRASAQVFDGLRAAPGREAALRLLRALSAQAWGGGALITAARNAALLYVARRRSGYAPARIWAARRRQGFARLLARLTPEPHAAARFLSEFTLGLELLSLGCRQQPLVTLLNDELLHFAFDSALGQVVPRCSDWFETSVRGALLRDRVQPVVSQDRRRKTDGRQKILEAGARILAEQGVTELTHRSVAAQAGVAVSNVSYHFRSIDDLLYAVYRFVQNAITEHAVALEAQRASGQFGGTSTGLRIGNAPAYIAALEAIIASAHQPQLAQFAWDTRLTRGVYHLYQQSREHTVLDERAFALQAYSIWAGGLVLMGEGIWSERRLPALLAARMARSNGYFMVRG